MEEEGEGEMAEEDAKWADTDSDPGENASAQNAGQKFLISAEFLALNKHARSVAVK